MSKRILVRPIKYGACFLLVFMMAGSYVGGKYSGALTARYEEFLSQMAFFEKISFGFQHLRDFDALKWYHWICDGLTLPSVILLSAGLLIWVSNAGALDLLGYSGRLLVQMFLPAGKKCHGTYGEYVAEKREKRVRGYGFLLVCGAVSLGVNFLFLFLYDTVA